MISSKARAKLKTLTDPRVTALTLAILEGTAMELRRIARKTQ